MDYSISDPGTQAANKSFDVDLAMLGKARDAALSLKRGSVGDNVMYFETDQDSALYDGKQITRAGLEDHFCGKLLGLPMGVDVCYTNHAQADQDDADALLTLLAAAGVNFVMGVLGAMRTRRRSGVRLKDSDTGLIGS